MPLRLLENARAFQIKRKDVWSKTSLRFVLNVKAFYFKRPFNFFIPQFHSVPASAWSSRPAHR